MIFNFLRTVMHFWKTNLILSTAAKTTEISNVSIKRGIFQGDALSALVWLVLAINPHSHLSDATKYGFQIKQQREVLYTISHLAYMDDIKLYATNNNQLRHLSNRSY